MYWSADACRKQNRKGLPEFNDNLSASGLNVTRGDEISQPFFSVKGRIIKVNGDDVQIFEYERAADADAEAALVSPDGSTVGTSMITWISTPHSTGKKN